MLPTQQQLRRILDYDPLTGVLYWRQRPECPQKWNSKWAGKVAGFDGPNGNGRQISIDNRKHYVHRVIWCWMTGKWPSNQVDHADLNSRNNRWSNLREATPSENVANQGLRSSNTSGLKGVSWSRRRSKWVAMITVERKQRHIVSSDCIAATYCAYAIEIDRAFGAFARTR